MRRASEVFFYLLASWLRFFYMDCGEVTEWPKVHDWKSCVGQPPTVGSNPTLSAIHAVGVNGVEAGFCVACPRISSGDRTARILGLMAMTRFRFAPGSFQLGRRRSELRVARAAKLSKRPSRRGAGVVERGGLENR